MEEGERGLWGGLQGRGEKREKSSGKNLFGGGQVFQANTFIKYTRKKNEGKRRKGMYGQKKNIIR